MVFAEALAHRGARALGPGWILPLENSQASRGRGVQPALGVVSAGIFAVS